MGPMLTKSHVMAGIQCPRRLWLEVNQAQAGQAPGLDAMRRFQEGQRVGEIARELFGPGQMVTGISEAERDAQTRAALQANPDATLFEATAVHDGVAVRADLLFGRGGGCDVMEVKSSTRVKGEHSLDCAVQLWALEGAGYDVRRVQVAVIDNTFVYPGGGRYDGLLKVEDKTEEVRLLAHRQMPEIIGQSKEILLGGEPHAEMGPHCEDPVTCPFQEHCRPANEPEYPISELPGIRKALREALEQEGYADIRDIPQGRLTNRNMERVRRLTELGQPELLPAAAQAVASGVPRYYIDFETISSAIPPWPQTRPYEQLPFQWSCHVETAPGKVAHLDFLSLTGEAPMREFAESLLRACGTQGAVYVYHNFESRIIAALEERFPDLAPDLAALRDRLVDLLPITRENYYHPAMHGSWSIKYVLPCIAPDLDYGQLSGVHNGTEAQVAYLEAISPATPPERKAEIEKNLRAYCEMDTYALVRLRAFLEHIET